MAVFNASASTLGFNMITSSGADWSAYDGFTGSASTNYSFISADGHDIELNGSGFTGGGTPTGGTVTSGSIDLNNDDFLNPDIVFSGFSGSLVSMTNSGAPGNSALFFDLILSGNDNVTGSGFDDTLKGLGGDDNILGGTGNDSINGGDGNDTMDGENGDDIISAGAGDDFLTEGATSGIDTLNGDTGDDYVQVNSAVFSDAFDGGADTDTIDWSTSSESGIVFDLGGGTATLGANSETMTNFENLKGTGQDDGVLGSSGANGIQGLGGSDTLKGVGGADTLQGGNGNDIIVPGDDQDSSDGGAGVDEINMSSETAAIFLDLTAGTANITGLFVESATNFENAVTGDGNDTISGTAAANSFTSGDGNDSVNGLDGNDSIFTGFGDDRANAGVGDDFVRTGPGKDTLFGGDNNDTLGASNASDFLSGQNGNDLLLGSNGNDRLFGGAGIDTLLGGGGRDTLTGDAGGDRLDGGAQIDVASYAAAGAGVWVRLWAGDGVSGDALGDTLIAIEDLEGSAFNDTLAGDNGNNRIEGGIGADILQALDGADILLGETGNDTMTGGAGNDAFWYISGDGADRITDFTAGAASDDVIRLFGFGAPVNTFAEVLALSSQVGSDVVINFGGGNSITLANVTLGSLHADDFVFG